MRGLLFGSFDGLHEGHDFLIRTAQKSCEELFIILATDNSIRTLKGREPRFNHNERSEALKQRFSQIEINSGDEELGTYIKLQEINPDTVFFGYDQVELLADFKKWMKNNRKSFKIEIVKPFKEDTYKSSLIYD